MQPRHVPNHVLWLLSRSSAGRHGCYQALPKATSMGCLSTVDRMRHVIVGNLCMQIGSAVIIPVSYLDSG